MGAGHQQSLLGSKDQTSEFLECWMQPCSLPVKSMGLFPLLLPLWSGCAVESSLCWPWLLCALMVLAGAAPTALAEQAHPCVKEKSVQRCTSLLCHAWISAGFPLSGGQPWFAKHAWYICYILSFGMPAVSVGELPVHFRLLWTVSGAFLCEEETVPKANTVWEMLCVIGFVFIYLRGRWDYCSSKIDFYQCAAVWHISLH